MQCQKPSPKLPILRYFFDGSFWSGSSASSIMIGRFTIACMSICGLVRSAFHRATSAGVNKPAAMASVVIRFIGWPLPVLS